MFQFNLFHVPPILTKKYIKSVGIAIESVIKTQQIGVINIIVTTPKDIAWINKTYRDKEGPTDILTFSFRETAKQPTDIAGEIYLCLEKIQLYAKERWVSYEEQLRYIIIHGLVHMMGYDHETEKESREMEKIEQKILVLVQSEK